MKNRHSINLLTPREQLRLFILRILGMPRMLQRFVRKNEFDDMGFADFLGLIEPEYPTENCGDTESSGTGGENFNRQAAIRRMKKLEDTLNMRAGQSAIPACFQDNFDQFGRILGLDQAAKEVLYFLALIEEEYVLLFVLEWVGKSSHKFFITLVAKAIQRPEDEVAATFSPRSPLIECDIIKWDLSGCRGSYVEFGVSSFARNLLAESFSLQSLICDIVERAPEPTLHYRDYAHLRDTLRLLRPFLHQVLQDRRKGVNIFIHGKPGTGKSELSRVLAREMRAALYEVSFRNTDGEARGPVGRLNALKSAQVLLAKQRALLVLDEAEDVFVGESIFARSQASKSKAWLNRMLETNPIPTLWISNTRSGLDPAFARRYDFIIELSTPPKKQRQRTYKRICPKDIPGKVIDRISASEHLTPAVVERAWQVVTKIRQRDPHVESAGAFTQLIRSTLKAQGHRTDAIDEEQSVIPTVYNHALINSDIDLNNLAENMASHPACRICFYGPPGTGKTTFGHWLARHLDKPILEKKASDLVSPFVGMTERHLAEAFQEARDDDAILMIDEVDSFLQERGRAQRSWEVSQVNEMLCQMERFNGIFIASTNLMDGLDQAALRRFDLKVYFDFLRDEQAVTLFKLHCKNLKLGKPGTGALKSASMLANTTPSDFANVARQHRFRGFASCDGFIEAVARECAMKKGMNGRKLGFSV